MEKSKRFGKGFVRIKTGAEGPKYDPYHYTELTVNGILAKRELCAVYHAGLGEWALINGVETANENARAAFETAVGVSVPALEKALFRPKACCEKPDLEEVSGYPGETLTVCRNCEKVVDCGFRAAVM